MFKRLISTYNIMRLIYHIINTRYIPYYVYAGRWLGDLHHIIYVFKFVFSFVVINIYD